MATRPQKIANSVAPMPACTATGSDGPVRKPSQSPHTTSHGAVPTEVHTNPATPLGDPYPAFVVRPEAGAHDRAAMRALRWEYRDVHRVEGDHRPLVRRGFAVLDIAGDDLTVTYVDDKGTAWLTERI